MKELTSLKEAIKILRNEDEKSEEDASQSRRDGKMLEEQRDEANREVRKVEQAVDRLRKEITKGRMKSDEEREAKDEKILELQQHKAEKEDENRRKHKKSVEEKKLRKKASEAKYRQISDLQPKTTDPNAEPEAAKKHVVKLRQQVEQKDEAKMIREQNRDEYRGLSAAPNTDIPPIAGPVRLSPRIHMPVWPQTVSLARRCRLGPLG